MIPEYQTYLSRDARERRRWFIALLVLAALSYAAFVLALLGPAWAHSWYTTTKDPETGLGCCGGQDCKPIPDNAVKLDAENGGWRYIPTGELIPFYRVQQSHDFKFHRCEYLYTFSNQNGSYKKGDTRCFFVPGGTM